MEQKVSKKLSDLATKVEGAMRSVGAEEVEDDGVPFGE